MLDVKQFKRNYIAESWSLVSGRYYEKRRNIARDFIQKLRARARRIVGCGATAAPVGGEPSLVIPGVVTTVDTFVTAQEHFIKEEEEQYAMQEE